MFVIAQVFGFLVPRNLSLLRTLLFAFRPISLSTNQSTISNIVPFFSFMVNNPEKGNDCHIGNKVTAGDICKVGNYEAIGRTYSEIGACTSRKYRAVL
jgi:hypothetical protein